MVTSEEGVGEGATNGEAVSPLPGQYQLYFFLIRIRRRRRRVLPGAPLI